MEGEATTLVANSILWNNEDGSGINETSQIHVDGGEVQVDYSCVHGWTGSFGGVGNIGNDPLFVGAGRWVDPGTPATADDDTWEPGDYHLTLDSPSIDLADPDSDKTSKTWTLTERFASRTAAWTWVRMRRPFSWTATGTASRIGVNRWMSKRKMSIATRSPTNVKGLWRSRPADGTWPSQRSRTIRRAASPSS